jgi:hypothetical protein
MDKLIGAIVAAVIVGVAVWLMVRSWRRRRSRDARLGAWPVPTGLAAALFETEVLYVASTPEGEPFERLAVEGLAFRGAGRLEVFDGGVLLRIAGEPPSFVPAERIVGVGAASHAIDRGVEAEGLVAITWEPHESDPGDAPVRIDSYFRARYQGDTARIIAAVHDITAAAAPHTQQEGEASDA